MTNMSHIHGSCHPILCSLAPSSCDLWRQAPIQFFVSVPFLSFFLWSPWPHFIPDSCLILVSQYLLSVKFSSSSSHLSSCALPQSHVPPSSGSTSILLISSQLCFHKYPAVSSFFMFFVQASNRCFLFQAFPLFSDWFCWQFFTRHWFQLQKPA